SKELRDEIVELGTRYGIVTPYTSYLVLEPGERNQQLSRFGPEEVFDTPSVAKRRADGRPVQGRQSAQEPARKTPPPAAVPSGVAGSDAVAFSRDKEELRKAEKLATVTRSSDSASQIRQVAGKTFYLRDGVWTDSEFKAEAKLSVVKLKFASDEYFDLIGQEPKLAECFALGQRVVVVWKGKVYQVEE